MEQTLTDVSSEAIEMHVHADTDNGTDAGPKEDCLCRPVLMMKMKLTMK